MTVVTSWWLYGDLCESNCNLVPFHGLQVSTLQNKPTKLAVIDTAFSSLWKRSRTIQHSRTLLRHYGVIVWGNFCGFPSSSCPEDQERVLVSRNVSFIVFSRTVFPLQKTVKGGQDNCLVMKIIIPSSKYLIGRISSTFL